MLFKETSSEAMNQTSTAESFNHCKQTQTDETLSPDVFPAEFVDFFSKSIHFFYLIKFVEFIGPNTSGSRGSSVELVLYSVHCSRDISITHCGAVSAAYPFKYWIQVLNLQPSQKVLAWFTTTQGIFILPCFYLFLCCFLFRKKAPNYQQQNIGATCLWLTNTFGPR